MTVAELKELLAKMPEDAHIRITNELASDEVDLVGVEYDGIYVIMRETDD